MHKKDYVEPAVDIISLATIQETMQSASMNGIGPSITFLDSDDFEDLFIN